MFIIIEDQSRNDHAKLVSRMLKLCEEVFLHELGWNVTAGPADEIDAYDRYSPAYLVWCDDHFETLYGSLRLLPATGPTLLYDVFRRTFPNNANLSAPGIWEGTRLCLHNDALARNGLNIDPRLAFCMMLLALCETALDHGIHTMVSNYEPPTRRLYTMAGAPIQEIGRSDGFGRRPVCAGTLEVSETVLATMQHRLGISERLMAPKSSTNPRIQHSQSIAPHHGGFSEPENPRGAFKHDTVAA